MVCQVRNHENATKKLDGGFASGIHGIGVAQSPVRTFTSRPGHFAVSRGLDTIARHLQQLQPVAAPQTWHEGSEHGQQADSQLTLEIIFKA